MCWISWRNRRRKLRRLLQKYNDADGKVKNVVLGCTHYPLVQDIIDEVLGRNIKFFNGAPYTAKHLKDVLNEKNLLNKEKIKELDADKLEEIIEFYDSSNSDEKKKRFFDILNQL